MELSDWMTEMGYENVSEICERRKQARNSLGMASYKLNLYSIERVMDFETGYIDDFESTCLIIADRLYEFGVGLAYYIQKNTNGRVLGVFERYEDAAVYLSENIDFVIYYGYQNNEKNYEVIKEVRSKPNPPRVIMVAGIDSLIRGVCMSYKINYQHEKDDNLSGLIKKLQTIQENGEWL